MTQLFRALVSISMSVVVPSLAFAQSTAFTYQGRLVESGSPANGGYDFSFALFSENSGNGQIGNTLAKSAISVVDGLFAATLDFGNQFDGADRWLEIGVRTNGGAAYVTLSPRHRVFATPYAITASNLTGMLPASRLSGSLSNSQLASNSITLNAGPGLSGGGTIVLGSVKTLTNTGIRSVIGNSDITASTANGVVTLGTAATSANIANAIVKRDSSGGFSAGSIRVDTNLVLTSSSAAGRIFSGTNTLVHVVAPESFFAGINAGNLTMSGGGNTGVGSRSLQKNTIGGNNTAIGYTALLNNISGGNNSAFGYAALYYNAGGQNNTAGGMQALYSNSSGSYNTAYGWKALQNNGGGWHNTAVGQQALHANTEGWKNTGIGTGALIYNTIGNRNTAVGIGALGLGETNSWNTAVGAGALEFNWIGNHNVALGHDAGNNVYVGSSNIFIASLGVEGDNNTIRIGTPRMHTNTFVSGIHGTTVPSGNSVFVDSSGRLGTLTSSERFKTNIQSMGGASGAILALRPVAFRYAPEIDPAGTPQFGLVAEEVAKVAPHLVSRDEKGRIYSVRYEAVYAMLLNEFLKHHQRTEGQMMEIKELKTKAAKVDALERRLAELEKALHVHQTAFRSNQ